MNSSSLRVFVEILSLTLHISDTSEISSGVVVHGSGYPNTFLVGVVRRRSLGFVVSSSTSTRPTRAGLSGLDLGLGLGFGVSERTSLTASSSALGGDLETVGWW